MESTYQKHISYLGELAGFIKNNSEKCDMDSKTCDVDTLKHLIQQNEVYLKCDSKHPISTATTETNFAPFPYLSPGHREQSA